MCQRNEFLPMYSTWQKWIHENTHQFDTQEFIDLYDLSPKVKNGYIYMEISRGTYWRSPPKRAQHTPLEPIPINYRTKFDTIIHEDPGILPWDADMNYIQQDLGSFLYYARAINMPILLAQNDITTQQAKPTDSTMKRVHQLLDYMATHPKAIIRFRTSDMILNIHSDPSYCSAGRGRSRADGYFFLAVSLWTNNQSNSTETFTLHVLSSNC